MTTTHCPTCGHNLQQGCCITQSCTASFLASLLAQIAVIDDLIEDCTFRPGADHPAKVAQIGDWQARLGFLERDILYGRSDLCNLSQTADMIADVFTEVRERISLGGGL